MNKIIEIDGVKYDLKKIKNKDMPLLYQFYHLKKSLEYVRTIAFLWGIITGIIIMLGFIIFLK